jgi:ribosomal protein S18 acetylase RimI-like enzyme
MGANEGSTPGSYDCPVSIDLRPATADDIDDVLNLWREATQPSVTDSAEMLTALVRRDPAALIVAESEGRIVGSVIAGWDGWRGAIYRLAVAPDYRRRRLGQALLGAAEERLVGVGARRLHAIVVETNDDAVAFWTASDWGHQAGQLRFAKGAKA